MPSLLKWITGYRVYKAPSESKNIVLCELLNRNIQFFSLCECENGDVVFSLTEGMIKRAGKAMDNCTELERHGLLYSLNIRKYRIGLVIGALMCVACIVFCSLFVWNITVIPSADEDKTEVLAALKKAGLENGSYIPDINKQAIENLVLIYCPELSYVSINIIGTAVTVRTDIRSGGNRPVENSNPADVAAGEDGYILRYETREGTVICSRGDTVQKGDILITGVKETKHHGTVNVRADGRVFALVRRSFKIEYPLNISEKYYTGREDTAVELSFMFFDITLKKAKINACQDVYARISEPEIFGVFKLPVILTKTTHRDYELMNIELTENECIKRAETLYTCELTRVLDGGELISVDKKASFSNGCYVISCEVWLVDDIAVTVPLTVTEKE